MIQDRNIVCVASNWFDHPTSKHHVMRVLSERNHILWINFHASRRPALTADDTRLVLRRLAQAWAGPRSVAPRIEVLSPLLIPMPSARWARPVNSRVLGRQVRRALRRLPPGPTQLWLFTPDIPELIDRLPTERVVYYCVDDFAAFSGFDAALIEQLERRTIAASDVVIASSTTLYEQRRQTAAPGLRDRRPRVHLVPHGVDFEHFATAAELPADAVPNDLKPIRRPIFGYMGLISDYVDLDLIARAARARPEWSFVLLGEARCNLAAVTGLKNVHLFGGRPYQSLPAYCRGFDVGLIPFRMNRLTRAVNPIKLREYLAAGLPVVSAPLEEVRRYAPAVQTAETLDQFVTACQVALELAGDGNRQARQELVRSESWRARVELLSSLVVAAGEVTERPTDARGPAAWDPVAAASRAGGLESSVNTEESALTAK